MKINKIKKLSNNKYKIEFNNNEKITTYDEVILKHNILYKKEIDDELLNKIQNDSSYYDVYNKVLKYILIKMRSVKEIYKYLEKKCVSKEDTQKIINQLEYSDMLNDEKFAKAFISDKINLSNIGPNKIKQELLHHNINENIINDILDTYDKDIFINKISNYISKKNNSKYSSYIFKQKIITDLINLGYTKDDIYSILNSTIIDSCIDKEFDKLYKKLSTKYDGNELKLKLKNKLYQKGYTSDEINNKLNEKK